jgi:uncharacterized protein
MHIVIAGGTGLIGGAIAARLTISGHAVTVLTRDRRQAPPASGVRLVEWDPDGATGPWAAEIDGADAVINLTGAGIADGRWTEARKEELRSSRVLPTRSLVAAIRQASRKPAVFLQGSAVGFYGIASGDRELDESFPPGDDFLGSVGVAWEAEALPVSALGCRLVILRSGVLLTPTGGVLGRMRLPFLWFVGGPVASGRQYVSWIHREDWIAMAMWALVTPTVSGVVNATAPTPVTNAVFSKAFAGALGRPSWFPVPGFMLRVLYGELATALLIHGQRVVPRRALELGFRFTYPDIDDAMQDAVGQRR